ncbi:PTS sugar transporter subunit IIC [Cetobacterium somerae]|uniref:PTS sugar transporter subunit IIC n=1 Tax=Cetobacterium sp. NK01 TaxID=2993530 RepID=UPI0021161945|nr:PTS sugar transporter subunit IIC [Cetobacterium sp. NK01]MCQ8213608.1 PTS sugar transporter subunit IIC [Cetobacterium sp. NK01]
MIIKFYIDRKGEDRYDASVFISISSFIAQCDYALGTSLISRPIVTGFLTGLVMGDLKMGLIMGATLS